MKQKLFKGRIYADEYNVSVDEAINRLRLQEDAGKLQAVLMNHFADDFGGAWIEHEPKFKVVIALISGNDMLVKPFFAGGPLNDIVEIVKVDTSYQELRTQQREASDNIHQLGVEFDAGIDIQGGWVEIFVASKIDLIQALQKNKMTLPDRAKILEVRGVGMIDDIGYFWRTKYREL